jgi:transposase-like protein
MTEINFCPFCDAPQHKLMLCKDTTFYCKECSRFFNFEELPIKCPRCKGDIRKSDFPSPSGEALFMCNKCKRTNTAKDLLEDEN